MVQRWQWRGTVLGKRQLNGRLKRHGNGNYGHRWFRCLNRFSKKTRRSVLFFQKKDEADLEIRRCEASKELPLCIRVEWFPGFVLDDHRTVDEHVHSLVRQWFTAKVHHHCDFPFDFVPLRDQKTFQRARVDVLAKPEAESLWTLKKESMIDAATSPWSRGLLARMRNLEQPAEGGVIASVLARVFRCLPLSRSFTSVSSGRASPGTQAQRCQRRSELAAFPGIPNPRMPLQGQRNSHPVTDLVGEKKM